MKTFATRVVALCSVCSIAACSEGTAEPTGPRIEIQVAPLQLPGVQGVQYALAVFNADPGPPPYTGIFDSAGVVQAPLANLVWQQASVTSNQYGDGEGAISYVGTCDASGTGPVYNWVALALRQVYVGAGNGSENGAGPFAGAPFSPDMSVLDDQNSAHGVGGDALPNDLDPDFVNPAPYNRALVLKALCEENQDSPVVFNLTIMRDAEQGFFDIAVNFEDIFCSAKVDCKDEFLHDGDARGPTVIKTLACTAGQGADGPEPTWMFLSDVTLTCVDRPGDADVLPPISKTISMAGVTAPGVQGRVPGMLFDWAQYQGQEGFEDVDKCYWNHAFGLDLAAIGARVCTLSGTATASDVNLLGGAIAADAVWPVINYSVVVLKADGTLCGNNPLDEEDGGGVWTSYVTPNTVPRPAPFAASYACGGSPTPASFACQGERNAFFTPVQVGARLGVQVSVAGVTSLPYTLPADATLDDTCCLANCCSGTP